MPIERNSTCSRKAGARSATEGTSTMTPGVMPRSRHSCAKRAASGIVAIIGAMTHGWVSASCSRAWPAAATASSWRVSMPRSRSPIRTPRTPSAGFSSCSMFANFSGLSEPASRVRSTTFWPAKAAKTSP